MKRETLLVVTILLLLFWEHGVKGQESLRRKGRRPPRGTPAKPEYGCGVKGTCWFQCAFASRRATTGEDVETESPVTGSPEEELDGQGDQRDSLQWCYARGNGTKTYKKCSKAADCGSYKTEKCQGCCGTYLSLC